MCSNKLTNGVLIEHQSHVPDFAQCCHLGAGLTALFKVVSVVHPLTIHPCVRGWAEKMFADSRDRGKIEERKQKRISIE